MCNLQFSVFGNFFFLGGGGRVGRGLGECLTLMKHICCDFSSHSLSSLTYGLDSHPPMFTWYWDSTFKTLRWQDLLVGHCHTKFLFSLEDCCIFFIFFQMYKKKSSLFVQAQRVVHHFSRHVWSFHLHNWRCFMPSLVFSVTTKDFLRLNTGTDELNSSWIFFIGSGCIGLSECA